MRMPFDDQRFDGAYAIESMTHMPGKEAFVAEVARVTRPGARFGIVDACVHDRGSLRSQPEFEFFSVVVGVRVDQWMEPSDVSHALAKHGFPLIEDRDLSQHVRRTYEIAGEYVRSRQQDLVKMYGRGSYELSERTMREGFKVLLDHGAYRLWLAERTGSIG
jgi:27-O-demethylrifamycin SV methyltransferase